MRDAEIAARAKAYADQVIADVLSDMPLVSRLAVKTQHRDKVATARSLLARAFVIGFAAGTEDAALPRRRR